MNHKYYQDEWVDMYAYALGREDGLEETREHVISTLQKALRRPCPHLDHVTWFAIALIFDESELTFETAYDFGWEYNEETKRLEEKIKQFLSTPRSGPLKPEDWL